MTKKSDNALLIETATTVRIMNERLFGNNGEGGAFHFMQGQHEILSGKLDANKKELLDKIELAKTDLQDKIDEKKKETDADIKMIRDDQTTLDRKVTRWSGAIGVIQFLITSGLVFAGIKYKAGH
jgi:hypothetical protein